MIFIFAGLFFLLLAVVLGWASLERWRTTHRFPLGDGLELVLEVHRESKAVSRPSYWRSEQPDHQVEFVKEMNVKGRSVVWGLSLYDDGDGNGPTWAYRTLGIPWHRWITERPPGSKTYPDHDRVPEFSTWAERKPRITAEELQRLVEEGVELRHEFEARTGKTRG